MATRTAWQIGDRVQGGTGEDFDCGTIREIDGDRVLVAWQSGAQTWTPAEMLEPATATYLTVAAVDLSDRAAAVLEAGDPIGNDVLAEIRAEGLHVTDPEAYLDGREGWYLDEDGHSHWIEGR